VYLLRVEVLDALGLTKLHLDLHALQLQCAAAHTPGLEPARHAHQLVYKLAQLLHSDQQQHQQLRWYNKLSN